MKSSIDHSETLATLGTQDETYINFTWCQLFREKIKARRDVMLDNNNKKTKYQHNEFPLSIATDEDFKPNE